jgi:hypothetical protein
MEKLILAAACATALSIPAAGTAGTGGLADYCTDSATGCEHAMTNTSCSGAGGFGAFGKESNFAGGANGRQTGINNSALCGNRQSEL